MKNHEQTLADSEILDDNLYSVFLESLKSSLLKVKEKGEVDFAEKSSFEIDNDESQKSGSLCEGEKIKEGESEENQNLHSTNYKLLSNLLVEPKKIKDENFSRFWDAVESSNSTFPLYPMYGKFAKNVYREALYSVRQTDINLINLPSVKSSISGCIESCLEDLGEEMRSWKRESKKGGAYNQQSTTLFIKRTLDTFFKELSDSDIVVLLGLNRTVGSLNLIPPDLYILWESFSRQHHPKSKLTVGARALTKHCHRSSEQFWGVCTGCEEAKNKHAIHILEKLFKDCVWTNIHRLPHQEFVLEVRCSLGYGVRWNHDGTIFRGFLEPQMENGHEVGWRH